MTDTVIEKKLIDHFLTLNDFSGIKYLTDKNVCLPNIPFTEPDDHRWFALFILMNEPDPAGLGENAKNLWTGFLQIDINVPIGAGKEETDEKLKHIYRLFGRGKVIDNITITKCYRAMEGVEETCYRTVVRVEFYAYLEKD